MLYLLFRFKGLRRLYWSQYKRMIYLVNIAECQYIQHSATTLGGDVVTVVQQHGGAAVIQLV